MSIVLAMGASMGWGLADFLGGLGVRNQNPLAVSFWRFVTELILLIPFVLIVPGFPHPDDLAWGALGGAAAAVSIPIFYWALGNGHMGTVAPVAGTVTASAPLSVGLLAGERPTDLQIAGMVIGLVSIALTSVAGTESHHGGRDGSLLARMTRRDIRLGVLCGVGFGVYTVSLHQTSDDSGLWPACAVYSMVPLCLALVMIVTGARFAVSRSGWNVNGAGAVCDVTGGVLYLLATRAGLLSIVGVVSSTYPVVTVIFAAAFLKEKLSHLHKVGLVAALASFVLIGVGQ